MKIIFLLNFFNWCLFAMLNINTVLEKLRISDSYYITFGECNDRVW